MQAAQWIEVVLIVLMAITLIVLGLGLAVALRKVAQLADRMTRLLDQTQGDVQATLRESQAALRRVESLAASTDSLLQNDVTPIIRSARGTVSQVERASTAVASSVEGVTRAAGLVETVGTADILPGKLGQLARTPGGRIALGLALQMGVGALRSAAASRSANKTSRRDSNGSAG